MTRYLTITLLLLAPLHAFAQGAEIAFGGLGQDQNEPVEVTADTLRIDQDSGFAVFSGSVLIVQGDMRMSAEEVEVRYITGDAPNSGEIDTMEATGGVTLVTSGEAAESQNAVYEVEDGIVIMTGDVLLTQGQNTLSGNELRIDVDAGTGVMQGRVRTIFQSSGSRTANE
ncbi:MAG: lipopolysaccharide transport periplasmic protein LptA [Pseudomonadota bacterium]